jgi:hypothetical protein
MTQQYQNRCADVTAKSLAQKGETPFRTILEPSQFNDLLAVLRLFDVPPAIHSSESVLFFLEPIACLSRLQASRT